MDNIKKLMIIALALTLSTSIYADDVSRLVSSYKKELAALQKVEDGKIKQRNAAIAQAQRTVTAYENTISSYGDEIKRYDERFVAPTKTYIDQKKTEAANLRTKISEYEAGLKKAADSGNYGRRGISGWWSDSAYGAADYQDLIKDSKRNPRSSRIRSKRI